MQTISAPYKPYNKPLLTAQARALFGARFIGCNDTAEKTFLTVYLTEGMPADFADWAALVSSHDYESKTPDQQAEIWRTEAFGHWEMSSLHGKSPAQIVTYLHSAMDGWATLADARADLKNWLPILAIAIAYIARAERT